MQPSTLPPVNHHQYHNHQYYFVKILAGHNRLVKDWSREGMGLSSATIKHVTSCPRHRIALVM